MGDLLAALGAMAGGAAPGVERGMTRRRERREAEAKKAESFQDWMRKFGIQQKAKIAQFGIQEEAKKRAMETQARLKREEYAANLQTALGVFGIAAPGAPAPGMPMEPGAPAPGMPMEPGAPGEPGAAVQPTQLDPDLRLAYAAMVISKKDPVPVLLKQGQRNLERRQAQAQAEEAAGQVPLPPDVGELGPEPEAPSIAPVALPSVELDRARKAIEAWEAETGESFEEAWRDPAIRKQMATMLGPPDVPFGVMESAMVMEEEPIEPALRAYQTLMKAGYGPGMKPWRLTKTQKKKLAGQRAAEMQFIEKKRKVEAREMAEKSLEQRQQLFAAAVASGEMKREEAVERFMPEIAPVVDKMTRVTDFFRGMNQGQVETVLDNATAAGSLARRFGLDVKDLKRIALAKFLKIED